MAAGDTALAVKTSSPPPTDHDDSVVSSPLSDVEDKDGDVDELDEEHGDAQQPHADASDDDSNLSDANDSEAETERLYHTPKSVGRGGSESVGNQFTDRQVPERSPSKLQNEIRVDKDKQKGDDEPEEAASDDERSSLASATLKAAAKSTKSEDVPLKTIEEVPKAEPETRKRKRSPVADQSESEQPLRKRTGSVATGKDGADEDTTMADEEPAASNAHSGDASPGEDEQPADAEEAADRAEEADADATATKTKKSKRNSPRTRKEGSHGDDAPEEEAAEALEDPPEGSATGGADDEAAAKPDEEQAEAEAEEDAEEAAKNAEELERKKQAYEQLAEIEKQFAMFRDRLYEERIAQLDQEEAMLRGDKPTHPEYLAMMQCIDARRDERLHYIHKEHEFRMQSLERWAVARRAQILSQFYQSVRETREELLENLGRQWYSIQHERRRYANSVVDYGLRFPTNKAQRVKDAIAYNKEVSILSGIAKYRGFPAAPDIQGASSAEVEDDMEAIARAKQAQQPQIVTPGLDYGGLPIGRNSLGPAGEQFLEQTPWANPNHPSNAHLLQRQPSASHHVPQTAGHQPAMHGHVKVQRQAKDIVAAEADAVSIRHVNGPSSHAKPAAPAKKLPRAPEQAPPSQPSSAPVAGPSQPKVKTHMGQKAPQDAPVKTEALPAGVAV